MSSVNVCSQPHCRSWKRRPTPYSQGVQQWSLSSVSDCNNAACSQSHYHRRPRPAVRLALRAAHAPPPRRAARGLPTRGDPSRPLRCAARGCMGVPGSDQSARQPAASQPHERPGGRRPGPRPRPRAHALGATLAALIDRDTCSQWLRSKSHRIYLTITGQRREQFYAWTHRHQHEHH